jgi:large exoprotein involved in heme utilization and adhesion
MLLVAISTLMLPLLLLLAIATAILLPTHKKGRAAILILLLEEVSAQACSASGNIANASSFTITRRGGMPTDPTKPLNSSYLSGEQGASEQGRGGDWETGRLGDEETGRLGEAIKLDEHKKTFSSDEVIPARGMIKNAQGQVVLTAYPTPNTTERNFSEAIACNGGI